MGLWGYLRDKVYYNLPWKQPKDYSDEKTDIKHCAQWSNKQINENSPYKVYGDAWTRSNQKVKKVYSGYDVNARPAEFDKDDVKAYTYNAADSVAKTIDPTKLKNYDVVGLYYRGSPSWKKAYENGTRGETQTHTGHIMVEDGVPYVYHNVHGNIIKNKVEDILGSDHPYGIVSVYRPYKQEGGKLNYLNYLK